MAGFDARTCGVSVCTGRQSRDIAQGIDTAFELRTSGAAPTDPYAPQGAGDRGTHRTPLLFRAGRNLVNSADLLVDAFGRIRDAVHDVVDDLDADELARRLDGGANSIAWLVWHLTRIQDDHVAAVAGAEQIWTADGWVERFALPFPVRATGYGHTARDVALVRVAAPELLTGYYDAVHERTLAFVRSLGEADLDRVVDESWTPAVTLGVRLISVVSDDLQHVGQAAFVRGVVRRG